MHPHRVFVVLFAALAGVVAGCGGEEATVFAASVRMDSLLASDVRALSVFVFGPMRTDGIAATCNDLMMQKIESTDPRLELLARADIDFSESAGREVRLEKVAAGEGRTLFVEARGLNDCYLANGCDVVQLDSGAIVTPTITVYRPRQPSICH